MQKALGLTRLRAVLGSGVIATAEQRVVEEDAAAAVAVASAPAPAPPQRMFNEFLDTQRKLEAGGLRVATLRAQAAERRLAIAEDAAAVAAAGILAGPEAEREAALAQIADAHAALAANSTKK